MWAAAPKPVAGSLGTETGTAAGLDKKGYIIGPGDILDIAVWKDEALTRSCVVRPDGAISFPLIGDVQAAGRTVSHLRKEIKERIARYVPGAVLSVGVQQVNSMIIYVIGKVNTPGRIVLNCNVDVLQALASAGGLNIFAKGNSIRIFRHEKKDKKTVIFPFEYDKVVDGKRPEQNIRLQRGDVIVVP
ncbi:MAG: polysaccharide biosynthesis/export family protein [Nitrospiraceae bacterium]|nr:polysaccharide biosynthesis/export family protein [Nitrospiraceae bacterium]